MQLDFGEVIGEAVVLSSRFERRQGSRLPAFPLPLPVIAGQGLQDSFRQSLERTDPRATFTNMFQRFPVAPQCSGRCKSLRRFDACSNEDQDWSTIENLADWVAMAAKTAVFSEVFGQVFQSPNCWRIGFRFRGLGSARSGTENSRTADRDDVPLTPLTLPPLSSFRSAPPPTGRLSPSNRGVRRG